jgi:hypothetical protein
MKLFDGDIKFESIPGMGSKFWIECPVRLVPEEQERITEDMLLKSFAKRSGPISPLDGLVEKVAGSRVMFVEDVSYH